jgi:subtilisin family serine protease
MGSQFLKLTKTGCGKPGSRPFTFALILALIILVALGSGLTAFPARAQVAGAEASGETAPLPAGAPVYGPGEVLVKFANSGAAERITVFLDLLGLSRAAHEIFREGEELLALLELDTGISVENAVSLLGSLTGVVYAEPNYIYHVTYAPADPSYPEQWGLNNTGQDGGIAGADISAEEAWDIEKGFTSAVTVAVIDSGIDALHPDLDAKIWDNTDEIPGNDIDDDGNGYADDDTGYNWAGITQSRWGYYSYAESRTYATVRLLGNSDYPGRRCAQAILGTGRELTHAGVILQKIGNPTGNVTVSLRSTLGGADLASFTVTPGEVDTYSPLLNPIYSEVYKPLSSPVVLAADTTYYLVLETTNNSSTDYYYLYENRGTPNPDTDQYDPYRDGAEWIWSSAPGWTEYADNDLYFHTNANANPRDDNGHGTHVGGIVGAEEGNGLGGVGVSFGAGLMPLKVMDCTGSGYNSDITAAIYYAADNGAQVINLSLGGTYSSSSMQDAVDYAHAAGVVVLAAAGNRGDTVMEYPAGYENVIGVGATTNTDVKAGFSEYNSSVDLTAPGLYIYSTMPTYPVALNEWYGEDYDFLSGTSMATPMASGLAVLVLSREPAYTPEQVEWAMEAYADDLGSTGRDDYFGYGRIDAFGTLDGMGAPVIDSLAPPSDVIGTQVTINGQGFGSNRVNSQVAFDGQQATQYDSWSDTAIACRVPPGISGQVQVSVTTPVATSNGSSFGVVPVLDSLDISSGPVGAEVAIGGSAFGASQGTSYVSFGGVQAASYTSWSDSQVVCLVPAGASGTLQVTVTTPGGTSNGAEFTVTVLPQPPHIDGIDPTSGNVGSEVTLGGSDFGLTQGTSYVSFGGVQAASYTSWSDSQVVCLVPAGASGTLQVTVTTPGGTSNSRTFTVEPRMDSLYPGSGEVGSRVDISGTAFGTTRGSAYVSFGGTPALIYESWSDTAISCYVPSGVSGEVEVKVTVPAGTSNGLPFLVASPPQAYTWYLAEGATAGGMETFILVQNPGDSEAEVSLTFITDSGPQAGPTAILPPHTRSTWKANDYVSSYDVSTTVTSDQPVVAERAMYGADRTWAHDSIGYSP